MRKQKLNLILIICVALAGASAAVDGQTVACDSEPVIMTTSSGVEFVRTPDSCFEALPDWPYEPHYVEIDEAWIEGSKGGLEVWGAFLGRLRIGWMSEPFSLERQTSAYNGGFLERSLPVQTMIVPTSRLSSSSFCEKSMHLCWQAW